MTAIENVQHDEDAYVLLLVTTKRDTEITQRLLRGVGLVAHACEKMADLTAGLVQNASALLLTEEVLTGVDLNEFAALVRPLTDQIDLPCVLLTKGGPHSDIASALLGKLLNLTILERPAPVSSIISAVQSAVRVKKRQREMIQQMNRIRDLQAQLTVALDASELGTFHCELPLGKMVWNTRLKAHFWLPPDVEVNIDVFYSILHKDDLKRVRIALEASVASGDRYDIEYRTVSPKGEIRWIRASGQVSVDQKGNPLQFSGTTQDITRRKKLEEERDQLLGSERAARVESERANRLKDEFLATLSHELRTPLNSIMGWVELLKYESDNPETIKEGMAVIDRNVRVQTQLIDDLLDVSRIISGKVRLDVKPLDFTDVIRAAVETVRPTALTKGVKLEAIILDQSPPVSGDAGRLQQVVWNLLTNAIKFTPRGGKVQLTLEKRASSLALIVADTGEGIPPDFLPHVFERFRQADGSPSRNYGGLGLGLSIVKTLTEMHGGTVAVASKGKGEGATFSIILPLRLARAEDVEKVKGKESKAPFEVPGSRPDLSGLTILVIDDEADARGMMHRLLTTCHALSVEAGSVEVAHKMINEFHPDLILSDIGMPGTDGYQFIREARRRGVATPAVALTAFARSEDRVRSIQAGYQAHLTKPIEPTELLTVVASLSGRINQVDR